MSRHGFPFSRLGKVGLAGVLSITAGCAVTSSAAHEQPIVPGATGTCPVFIMWPTSDPAAFHGNVGIKALDIESLVANRILEVARERCPASELVRPGLATPVTAIPGYAAALHETGIASLELAAASFALERGANCLLVPRIEQWNQNRTDDPIGALTTPRNRIAVSLRLMRLDIPAVAGRVRFENRSRLTLNQAASRLLNGDFDATVRALDRTP